MANKLLDEKLLDKLSKRLNKNKKYVQEQISKKAGKNRVSSQAYFVHWLDEFNIGAAHYRSKLDKHIQEEIRSLKTINNTSNLNIGRKKKGNSRIEKNLKIKEINVSEKPVLLTNEMITNAKNNSELYPFLYLFENCLRNLIILIMEKEHGKNWWDTQIKNEIKASVVNKIKKEKLNPWVGNRSHEPIFYTDFIDLSRILKSRTKEFSPIFQDLVGGLNWLTQKIDELYLIRNNLAHACPLKDDDRNLLITYFKNFYLTIDIINSKI
jgi:hypothetical protein